MLVNTNFASAMHCAQIVPDNVFYISNKSYRIYTLKVWKEYSETKTYLMEDESDIYNTFKDEDLCTMFFTRRAFPKTLIRYCEETRHKVFYIHDVKIILDKTKELNNEAIDAIIGFDGLKSCVGSNNLILGPKNITGAKPVKTFLI